MDDRRFSQLLDQFRLLRLLKNKSEDLKPVFFFVLVHNKIAGIIISVVKKLSYVNLGHSMVGTKANPTVL
jgi:hypothetical protein